MATGKISEKQREILEYIKQEILQRGYLVMISKDGVSVKKQ